MRKLLLTLLASFTALGLSCSPQTDTNRNANVNANATPAVKGSPTITNSNVEVLGQFDEESRAVIKIVDRAGASTPGSLPCVIEIDKPEIKLRFVEDPEKTKVQWRFEHKCRAASKRPVTAMVKFDSAGAFGPDPCDNRLFVDFVKEGKSKRVVSRTAISPEGRYKYTISAYMVNAAGVQEKVAPDLDPEIQIGGVSLSL